MQELFEAPANAALREGAFKFTALFMMIAWSLAGSFALRKAATMPDVAMVLIGMGMAAWSLSAVCFAVLLRDGGSLGVWGPLASMVQMGLVMAISAILLNESYSTVQWTATGIAIAAMGVSLAASS